MIAALIDLLKWDSSGKSTLPIRVTPKASSKRVRIEKRPEGPIVRIDVTVAPEDGKANKQVIKLMVKELGLPKSALLVIRGTRSKDKVIAINKG